MTFIVLYHLRASNANYHLKYFFWRVFVAVSVIKLMISNLHGYLSHRDNNLRPKLGAPLYLLMGSQLWGKKQQGKGDMRQLKLQQRSMEAQMSCHPVMVGCLTLQKRCKLGTLTKYVMGNKKLTNAVISKHYKKKLVEFENSVENIKRSVATFYASCIMGKRKYQSVRLVLSMKSCESKQGKKGALQFVTAVRCPSF